MEYKEAIDIIKMAQAEVQWEYPMEYATAFDMAIQAMELQVAKPVKRTGTYLDQITGHCPNCGWKSADQRGFTSYCEECGQKLIWQ